MSDWRDLRIPGDKPCSCSGDCDAYILALEAERDRYRMALERITAGLKAPASERIARAALEADPGMPKHDPAD